MTPRTRCRAPLRSAMARLDAGAGARERSGRHAPPSAKDMHREASRRAVVSCPPRDFVHAAGTGASASFIRASRAPRHGPPGHVRGHFWTDQEAEHRHNSRTRSEAASASARAWAAAPRRTRSAAATTRFWLSRSESWRSGRRAVSLACAARAEATSSCASASAALAAFAALNGAAFPDAAASTRRHARSSSAAATHRRRSAPCPRRP